MSKKYQIIYADRIILDLCGGTGAWSRLYKEAGYDVRNITLPDYDVRTYSPPPTVYGILAAPPCTEFSRARQKNRYMTEAPKRNLRAGMEIVNQCLRIITETNTTFWALENPVGLLRRFLWEPDFTFQPWQYGDPWTKHTDLWGIFNIPPIIYHSREDCLLNLGMPVRDFLRAQGISPSIRPNKILPSKADLDKTTFKYVGMKEERSAFRAITPAGFARAFFEVNK